MAKQPSPDNVESWPVIWRVVIPRASADGKDWLFIETEHEAEAREEYGWQRRHGWPVRLERVQCGPFPAGYLENIEDIRRTNGGEGTMKPLKIEGAWVRPVRRKAVARV